MLDQVQFGGFMDGPTEEELEDVQYAKIHAEKPKNPEERVDDIRAKIKVSSLSRVRNHHKRCGWLKLLTMRQPLRNMVHCLPHLIGAELALAASCTSSATSNPYSYSRLSHSQGSGVS